MILFRCMAECPVRSLVPCDEHAALRTSAAADPLKTRMLKSSPAGALET
jgi:hypothetical protein